MSYLLVTGTTCYGKGLPKLAGLLLILVLPILMLLAGDDAQVEKNAGVIIEGVWSDACPCKIPCPCWRTGHSNVPKCLNFQVFHINQGFFQGADIGKATFVLAAAPDAPYEQPEFLRIYGVEGPGTNVAGDLMQRVFGIKTRFGLQEASSMKVVTDQRRHTVDIPKLLHYDVGAARTSQISGELSMDVASYLYPWIENAQQWEVRKVRLRVDGHRVTYSKTNSIFGQFALHSPSDQQAQSKSQTHQFGCAK